MKLLGAPQVLGRIAKVAGAVSTGGQVAKGAREVVGRAVADAARARVEVLTGETRESITSDSEKVEAAGASVYLEFGTSKMAAEPFMRPAADEVGPAAVADAARQVASAITGVL